MAQDAGIPAAEVDKSAESSVFADALKASMEEVNTRGSEAQSLRESYERGDPNVELSDCLLYTSPSPRDGLLSRMPSSA